MLMIHLVTQDFLPQLGGLEKWTFSQAQQFKTMGFEVVIHVMAERQPIHEECIAMLDGVEISWLSDNNKVWMEPITFADGTISNAEKWRINYLCLRNSIARIMDDSPHRQHVLLSNYLLTPGFLAAMVAENLQLQHIACVVGTDFSRGFRNPNERLTISNVLKGASCVVTLSHEQEAALSKAFSLSNVVTIHTAADPAVFDKRWTPVRRGRINIFSDCGFSHKKGTQVLLSAFASLIDEGLPLSLTICGNTQSGQEDYWEQLKKNYLQRIGPDLVFRGFLESPQIWDEIVASDVYCSATMGEGCSQARTAALCLGVPLVSTSCGELPDVVNDATHIRLARTGDPIGFLNELRRFCVEYSHGNVDVDSEIVDKWRSYFSPARELSQWKTVFDGLRMAYAKESNAVCP